MQELNTEKNPAGKQQHKPRDKAVAAPIRRSSNACSPLMSKILPADTPDRREQALDDERTVEALLRACRVVGGGVVGGE